MKKIALFLALAVLPSVASAELTATEAAECANMKLFAETATSQKLLGVSRGEIYSRLANGSSPANRLKGLAYLSVDMVFDGYSSFDVRAACIDALKD